MQELSTTFTPADGSAPRTITLRIGDPHPDPDDKEEWWVDVEVLGFNNDLKTRLPQVDWPNAIRTAAQFITDIVAGKVENAGGGTLDPDIYPPTEKKKRKRRKPRKAKKDRK
jgi:hypothetical protein